MVLLLKVLDDCYLNEFGCALSEDNHIVQDPLMLNPCRHYVCKDCLNRTNINLIKCRFCSGFTKRDLVSGDGCSIIRDSIKLNIEKFFVVIQNQMNKARNIFLGMLILTLFNFK